MSKIKAFLFDLDGTIIDSEQFHFDRWNEFLQPYNITIDFKDWLNNYAGIPLPQNAKNIISKYKIETDYLTFVSEREQLTNNGFKNIDIHLMPHVLDFIAYFYEKGITLAVVTASPRPDVEAVFNRNGLAKYFKLFVTRTDVSKSKPDPESYLVCVEKLGITKEECLVFEDTLNGVKSGVAAGIKTFGVQNNIRLHQKLKIADELFLNFAHVKSFLISQNLV